MPMQCNYPEYCYACLPAGVTKSFRLDVQPAPNAPFDVYFLMDLSASLEDDLATLRSLTSDIGRFSSCG